MDPNRVIRQETEYGRKQKAAVHPTFKLYAAKPYTELCIAETDKPFKFLQNGESHTFDLYHPPEPGKCTDQTINAATREDSGLSSMPVPQQASHLTVSTKECEGQYTHNNFRIHGNYSARDLTTREQVQNRLNDASLPGIREIRAYRYSNGKYDDVSPNHVITDSCDVTMVYDRTPPSAPILLSIKERKEGAQL